MARSVAPQRVQTSLVVLLVALSMAALSRRSLAEIRASPLEALSETWEGMAAAGSVGPTRPAETLDHLTLRG